MNRADVIEKLGVPDLILPPGKGMVSFKWFCSTCCKLHTFETPVRVPAPCECGGISFEKRS